MKLKYLRISAFYTFLRPYSEWTRKRRMRAYTARMGVREGMSILDLGGLPPIWDGVSPRLNLTILNLPGIMEPKASSHHKIRYVEGDACHVWEFKEQSFDSVFSNSVIEHVGSVDKQAAFAAEVRRLGKSYWVQTPSRWFPIEAHCGMPFWWFYPARLRRYFMESWRKKLPEWTEMVETTTVVSKASLQRFFPEATIATETFFGIPKSYIAYFPGDRSAVAAQSRESESSRTALPPLAGTAK
jgi:hypothetical protein